MGEPIIQGFAPIANRNASILILGSMPGNASLAAGRYYAHPQNAFWRIMAALLRIDAGSPYRARTQVLKSAGIALWDVLQSCTREGSLDAMIDPDAEIANDFAGFFRTHRQVTRVFFNGAKAEACFKRHVLPVMGSAPLSYARLPSTSPAHASMPFERKLAAWQIVMAPDY
ncbi:MAG: DNA-deoxyinosine glycosylase [Betaproteobacteria bacterium]|nr:DNA-deoxyinosine glycosylase [Betaproteobacteria bacterium]